MGKLWIVAALLSALSAQAQVVKHVDIFKEPERFAGWPANYGIWSWGDEVLVGFSLGYYKKNPTGGHDIDSERPSSPHLARSLDGGETWTIEPQQITNVEGGLTEPIDFSNPDMALQFRGSNFFHSADRGKSWTGPYPLLDVGRESLLARTDYIVEDKSTVTAFIAATKANGKEGQPLCIRTKDGGRTWELVGWIGQEPPEGYGYAIMPSTVRLDNGAYLSMIRRAGVFDGARDYWIEAFLSPDNGEHWYMLDKPRIESGGNPASMIILQDGRIAVTYGHRLAPFGMRAILSDDNGQTWGKEIVLRHDAANWDIGYPRTVQRTDGKILTIYYYHHPDQVERYIACTIWDPGTKDNE